MTGRKPNLNGLRWCSKGKHYTEPDNFRRLTDSTDGKAYDCNQCCKKRKDEYYKLKSVLDINWLLKIKN